MTTNTPIDMLQIKIEKAKKNLSEDTLKAIANVDWKNVIINMRQRRGFTFEQIEALELETELLLSGLLNPEEYPDELEKKMKLSKPQINDLVKELNELIFEKIREEFVKITENKKDTTEDDLYKAEVENLAKEEPVKKEGPVNTFEGNQPKAFEMLKVPNVTPNNIDKTKSEPVKEKKEELHPMISSKVSEPYKAPAKKTEYSLDDLPKKTQGNSPNLKQKEGQSPKVDPYREIPE